MGLDFGQSPCIRNCCLDDDLTCLGCFRSLDEIKEWGLAEAPRRAVILANAKFRSEQYLSDELARPKAP